MGGGLSGSGIESYRPARKTPGSDIGKFNADTLDPMSAVRGVFNFIGSVPGVGLVNDVAGNVGNVGIPGTDIGVKQGLGVAGEALSGPQNLLQTQVAKARINEGRGVVDNPLDWLVQSAVKQERSFSNPGGLVPDVLGLGSSKPLKLPADLQAKLDSGTPV
jgi:hypothetical protein